MVMIPQPRKASWVNGLLSEQRRSEKRDYKEASEGRGQAAESRFKTRLRLLPVSDSDR